MQDVCWMLVAGTERKFVESAEDVTGTGEDVKSIIVDAGTGTGTWSWTTLGPLSLRPRHSLIY